MLCLYIVVRFCPPVCQCAIVMLTLMLTLITEFMSACNIIILTGLIYGMQYARAGQSRSSEYLLWHFNGHE